MSISFLQPMPAGTALRVYLAAVAGADRYRLLRNETGAFSGPDDPLSAVLLDGVLESVVVDAEGLRNGATYHYRLFARVGGQWLPSGDASGVPRYSALVGATEPMILVRDRLADGLNSMIESGALANQHGRIQVLTAPPAADGTDWPVVTVHLSSEASGERAIGEMVVADSRPDDDGMVTSTEGWLTNVSLTIIAWCLNPDERIALRRAVSNIVIANLPVLEGYGIQQVDLSQEDTEDFESYNAPVYQAMSTMRFMAPAAVASRAPAIREVSMTLDPAPQQVRGFGRPYPPINKLHY